MGRGAPRWEPPAETLAHFPEISGNTVNGLGEAERRPPSPFFWHEASLQTHGELQKYVVSQFYDPPEVAEAFNRDPVTLALRPRGPDPIPVAAERAERSAAEWTELVKAFALANEADLVGIAQLDPLWIFEGFEIAEKWLIVLGFAHDYDEISKAPAVPGRLNAGLEVGRQYTRAARSANTLRNFIREQGWPSESFPGPRADALLMIPAAIAAGLGELGKHGSIINRTHGASFRLSAVSTDMPLLADEPDVFGADEFCTNCRICTDACPPDAIGEQKQLVRGDDKWYVDFDRCIPYFAETKGCAICIARCPWSRPGIADNLLVKLARRRERLAAAES
ncbi:MAG TPA: 4Fe-4S dicluster domain-containing protein [Gaiellaceae bacterium]|nr:4Fe-4S dicluster domain-containing protein [Gaiellaceae bacterium]